jgi:hypothetical protein
MMRRQLMAGALALACSAGIVAAQTTPGSTPQQPRPPSTTTPAPAAQDQQAATTLVGCLYRENQIPGRSPNVVERAGILEDYVLADASAPGAQPAPPGATPGAIGTSGTAGSMYKVEHIADDKLKTLVGKRVEVMGRINPEGAGATASPGATTPDRGPGPDDVNLPEFEAASIREVSGPCPATPASPSR